MASYPEYSADFFDGEHFVMKGASPATARELIRPTFRNWFRAHYPYVYATVSMRQKHLTPHPPPRASRVSEREAFADDVGYYLSLQPRQLPSRYFYDALGSALFEAICRLPWYRVTRAETRLLECTAAILRHLDPLSTLVELGPGSGEKLVSLIALGPVASERRSRSIWSTCRAAALDSASRLLSRARGDRRSSRIDARYEAGWPQIASRPRGRAAGRSSCFWDRTSATSIGPGAAAFLRGD